MNKYSYVSVLTSNEYVFGIMLLVDGLTKTNSQYSLHVLVTKDIDAPSLEILRQLNVTYELIDEIFMPDFLIEHNRKINVRQANIWQNCLTKIKIFDLTQFDKIIFLDADIMLLKNIDHLFERPHMTAALDGEYFNLWPNDPHFNTGCLVIEPNHNEYEQILQFINYIDEKTLINKMMADQELLNLYYKDWPQQKELHLNKWYNIFPPYITDELNTTIYYNAYFLHFVGKKPWQQKYPKLPNEIPYSHFSYQTAFASIQKQFSLLNYDLIKDKIKLTVYAICKNEIDNIDEWVKCFSKADYVCVLDTGSTDGSYERLQQLTNKYSNLIIDQQVITPWRFDVARNKSLELCPKDTVIWFMVDLDERIKEDNWAEIIKDSWAPSFSRGEYIYYRDVGEDGTVFKVQPEYRIHSKKWNHYKNIVHELLYDCYDNAVFYYMDTLQINIQVWHYPKPFKETNYVELCKQALLEDPTNDVMRLQLAIEYQIVKDFEKARECYQQLITIPINKLQSYERAACFFGLGRIALQYEDNRKKALQYYSCGRVECPGFFDNYIDAAMVYYEAGEYNKVIDLCESSMKNCFQATWCSLYDSTVYYTYYLLGLSYYNIGQKERGLGYLEVALFKHPNDQEIIDIQQNILQEIVQEQEINYWQNQLNNYED